MSSKTIPARVDSELALDNTAIPKPLRWAIAQHFVVKNPEVEKRRKIGLSNGHVPQHISFYKMRSGPSWEEEMVLPRGAFTTVARLAARYGTSVSVEGRVRVSKRDSEQVPVDDLMVELREYQREAVDTMLRRVQGYVALPCGAGKTVLGAAALLATGQPAIVLVHTEDLMMQWSKVFEDMYGVDVKRVGAGGGDYRWRPLRDTEVCVAMVQTLHANQQKRATLLQSAGAVLMDECHHAPADSFRNLFRHLPARYRWGLTATPDRPDGWGCLLPMFIGPQLYSMKPRNLVEMGYLMMPTIVPVSTGISIPASAWGKEFGGTKKSAMALNWLCKNEERRQLLVDVSLAGAEDGRTCLILVPRVKLAYWLADKLNERGIDTRAITGRVNKSTRAKAIADLRKGRLQAVVATQLADEGLDVPTLDFLVNASTGKASGRAIQRIGRAMRTAPGKNTPVVVDLVDHDPVFQRQWQARAIAYRNAINATIPTLVPREASMDVLMKTLHDTKKRR